LAFAIGVLLLIPVGLSYAELTACMPVAGGPIMHSYKAFGSFFAFLTGWAYVLGYIPICVWESVSLGAIIGWIIPEMSTMPLYSIGNYIIYLPQLLVGLIATVFFTIINVLGIKLSSKFQTIVTMALFIIGFSFVIAAIVYGNIDNMQPLLTEGSFVEVAGKIIRVLTTFVIFLVCGFETVPQQAEERSSEMEPKNFWVPLILAIVSASTFYISIIVATSMIVPWRSLLDSELPVFDAIRVAFKSPTFVYLITACALAGLLTTFNGLFIAGSRILLALAREQLIPNTFVKIHPRHRTPYISIIAIGLITFVGTFFGKSIWLPLVNLTAFGFAMAWFFETTVALKLRFSEPNLCRPYKMYGGKVTATIGAILCALIIILLLLPGSSAQIVWPTEYLILATWLAIGIIFYYYSRKILKKKITQ